MDRQMWQGTSINRSGSRWIGNHTIGGGSSGWQSWHGKVVKRRLETRWGSHRESQELLESFGEQQQV